MSKVWNSVSGIALIEDFRIATIPALARHAVWDFTHQGTGALVYGILGRTLVHKHVAFVEFNSLIAWDLPADSGTRIRAEESETTI